MVQLFEVLYNKCIKLSYKQMNDSLFIFIILSHQSISIKIQDSDREVYYKLNL